MRTWGSNLGRLAHIAAVLARHALVHALGGLLCRWAWLAKRLPPFGLSGPQRLRAVLEDLGGTFVKFGQMLALQPDIIPYAYCNALFDLLDRIAPFEFAQVEEIFVEELGCGPGQIFDSFDPQPLSTASIGQVHVAYLDERKLAVKVQRPEVEKAFAGDIRLMTAAIGLIRVLRLRSLYWMTELLSEFITWTREELDYRCEVRYMEQIRCNARDNPSEQVPEVLKEYATRRILVSEFFDGATVLDYLRALESNDEVTIHRLWSGGFDADAYARNIIDNFFGDAFQHGLFHADLHPANLVVLSGNAVGYVDFGIAGVLSHYARHKMVAMTLACTRADLDGLCAAFFEISTMDADPDVEEFRQGIEEFAGEWFETTGGKLRMRKNFTLVMLDMLKLSRRTGIRPQRDVVKYIRSSIAADGLITRFAPDFDVSQYLGEVCKGHLEGEAQRELLSHRSLIDWSNSSARLLRDGPQRAIRFLDQAASGEWPASAVINEPEADRALRWRAVHLGATVLAISLLVAATGAHVQLGVNLFTAEVVVVATAAAMLLQTLRKIT